MVLLIENKMNLAIMEVKFVSKECSIRNERAKK